MQGAREMDEREELEQRDDVLNAEQKEDPPAAVAEAANPWGFGETHEAGEVKSDDESFHRSRSRSPIGSMAEAKERYRRQVGGHSDAESDWEDPGNVSDASVNGLAQGLAGFGVPQRPRPPKRKARGQGGRPKRARPAAMPRRSEADEVKDDLNAAIPDDVLLAGAVDDDEPEPMPARVVDWEEVDEEEPEKNPDLTWCALCKHTQRQIDVGDDNPYIPDLRKHAADNWTHVETVELMQQLQNKYNAEIRPYIEQVDQRLPWHKSMIFKHFTRHEKESRIKYEVEADAVDEMIHVMLVEEMFIKNKKTGRKNVNLKKLQPFFKLLGQQERFEKLLKTMRPQNVL